MRQRFIRMQNALFIYRRDVSDAQPFQHIDGRRPRRTDAVDHNTDIADSFSDDTQGIRQGRGYHRRGSILVVVNDRHRKRLLKPLHDVEAGRCRHIFQVEPAERRLKRVDRIDKGVFTLCFQAQRHAINADQHLEHGRLAFHDRNRRMRTGIAEPENSGSIRHDSDKIVFRRLAGQVFGMFQQMPDDMANARRIRGRKIIHAPDKNLGEDLDLAVAIVNVPTERQRPFREGFS